MPSPLKFGSKLTRSARTQILRRIRGYHAQGLALHVAFSVVYLECTQASTTYGASHFARLFETNNAHWYATLRQENEHHACHAHDHARRSYGHDDETGKLRRYYCPPLDFDANQKNRQQNGRAFKNAMQQAQNVLSTATHELPNSKGAPTPNADAAPTVTSRAPAPLSQPAHQGQPQQNAPVTTTTTKPNGKPTDDGKPSVQIDTPETTRAPGAPEVQPLTLPSELGTHAPMRDGGHGSPDNMLRMPGEPAVSAALVDALKGRRRAEVRRGLDCGELDLSPSRLALTGGGLDLGRAWQRRTTPDTRRTLVGVLLDYSISMKAGGGPNQLSRYQIAARAAAMILRALERERIDCAAWRYAGAGAEPIRALAPVKTTLREALRKMDISPDGKSTDAPRAAHEAAREMVKIRADRRVLIVLCDDDMAPDSAAWRDVAEAGIEVWGISIAAQATDPWTTLPDCAGWTHRWQTGAENLPAGWSAAMRAGIGRIHA